MFNIGDRVSGRIYNDCGPEMVDGAFLFRTDDPEEMIQDIVVRTDDGRTIYIDEQEARLVNNGIPLTAAEKADFLADTLDMDEDLYDRLYTYYTERSATRMPYGTAKARDGDPQQWIYDQLVRDLAN